MFTSDVIEQLKYYVYRLIDPRTGQTFYVGKGKGNRIFAHINDALKNYEGESYVDSKEDDVSSKIQQIRDIRNSGLEVIHIIQRYGLTEKEAFEVEAALIDCYAGLTNIQGGYAVERGVNNAEVLQRELSCETFKDIDDLEYCIIKINSYWLGERGSVYETVRKHWKVNLNRINKIPYVLASHNGVIIDVFKVDSWYNAPDCPGRCMFDGKQASEEVRNLFVNKRLPNHYMKKGMASPVLYHDELSKKGR
ncbi:MAG: LEM-3-like GIY-YIG domain-containing protein [Hominimerdicola sp.]